MVGLLVLLTGSIIINTVTAAMAADTAHPSGKANIQRLDGRWIRPDGGYILELREIRNDGTMKASYSNPRSVNVHKAQHSVRDGKISIFVELRDVNYPGSTYTMHYDPVSDRLKGNYFQAVHKEIYYVEFVRAR